jgi:hypothetical protein
MSCDDKKRLATEYESAAKFSQAVADLRRKIGTSTKEEYRRLDRAANEARIFSEQARLALGQHIATHGCRGCNIRRYRSGTNGRAGYDPRHHAPDSGAMVINMFLGPKHYRRDAQTSGFIPQA